MENLYNETLFFLKHKNYTVLEFILDSNMHVHKIVQVSLTDQYWITPVLANIL